MYVNNRAIVRMIWKLNNPFKKADYRSWRLEGGIIIPLVWVVNVGKMLTSRHCHWLVPVSHV